METINNIFKNRCLFRIVMRVLILVSMLGMSSVAYSQAGTTYPVEINAMLTPPYGTCLTDYVGTNRFQCNVLMRDMRATEYYFRIVMTVKDQASGRVVFQTQSDRKMIAPGRPVYMAESGIFGEFFKSQNIKQNYSVYKDGCLKEGAYNFVFQVVDDKDSRHIPISKECVFTARLNEGGAPLLTFPFTGDSIGCDATPINLTWQMPFVTGEQIEYLVEVCPNYNGISGLDCLNNNSKPANFYYSARSFMPMHQLVKTTTMLTPNTTYYWRVSIIDQFGKIKPNSTSKIDSFVYCGTPIEPEPYIPVKEPMVKAIAANLDTVKFDSVLTKDNSTKAYWTLDEVRFNYIAYALDVRKKSQDTWSTYHIEIKQEDPEEKDNYGLSNLKYNEPYEARMQYLKLSDNGDTLYAPFSDTITFTVPNPMDTADCGEILPIKDCNDAKGLVLKQYDTLYANGTPVVLDSVTYKSGDSSVISGFGTVAFPILSNFKLKMQFKEISVNCYGELLKGKVVSVYNESTGAIIDLNHMFGKGDGGGSQSSSEQPEPKKYASKEEAQKNLSTGGFAQVGDSIYTKDPSGNLVPLGKSISMTDEQYTNNNRLDEDNVYCVFHNDTENAEYIGFDADEQNVFRHVASLKDHYESFSKQAGSSDPYIIPYVASNPGRVVKLTATLDGKGWSDAAYNKDSVKFVMPLSGGNYLSLNAKKDGDKFIVDFPGSTPDTHSDVYAIAKKGEKYVNVGKIIVESYEWRKQKVKFVPVVNDYTVDTDAISKELNKIYGRFGITYEVSVDEKFETENINSEFLENFSIGSGVFTKQSDDMKRLQCYYKEARGIEDSTAYLFLLKSAAENGSIDGDMPQGQICGYIFMHSKSKLEDGRLVAHELAHGIYRLDHVFEKAYGIKENSTNNLLDYNNGNQLAHHQWELIKNPGFAWALLESDEDNLLQRLRLDNSFELCGGHVKVSNFILQLLINDQSYVLDLLDRYKFDANVNDAYKNSIADDILRSELMKLGYNDQIKIYSKIECHNILLRFIEFCVNVKIGEIQPQMLKFFKESNHELSDGEIKNKVLSLLGYASWIATFADNSIKEYCDYYSAYKVIDDLAVSKLKTNLINGSVTLKERGVVSVLEKMSITQFKKYMYENKIQLSKQDFNALLLERKSGKFTSNLVEKISDVPNLTKQQISKLNVVIKDMDNVSLYRLASNPGNINKVVTLEKSTYANVAKAAKWAPLVSKVSNFLTVVSIASTLANSNGNVLSLTPADYISCIPHPISLISIPVVLIVDQLEEMLSSGLLDNLTWSMVLNWQTDYSGRHQIPQQDLYMHYVDYSNPSNVGRYSFEESATSAVITDKKIAEDIFGFVPTHVVLSVAYPGESYKPQYPTKIIKCFR